MRKKLMRWLAAGMALCLTLGPLPPSRPRTRPFLKKSFLIPSISKTKDVT